MRTSLSYIELSKHNLVCNIKALKAIAGGTKVIGVLKGNAYGHGQNEIAQMLESHVDAFQVNSYAELKLLRRVTKKKVFILGFVQKDDLKDAIKLGCILSAFSLEKLREINEIARKTKRKQEVHVPFDALLGREGFMKEELESFFIELKKCKNIILTGIYSHFANIEDTNNFTHASKQIKKYEEAIKVATKFNYMKLERHISATSGLLVYEKNKKINTFVRLGIGLYGLWPSEHIKYLYKNKLELRPVLSWKTKIAQVKRLPAGYTVGYGLTYMTYEPTKIAVIPVGYADGYDRKLSNSGEVLIRGERCKILGRVAMNMFVVDVTKIINVQAEEEVVLIGKQAKEEITVEEIAKKIDSINYEIVTRLSSLVPRVVK